MEYNIKEPKLLQIHPENSTKLVQVLELKSRFTFSPTSSRSFPPHPPPPPNSTYKTNETRQGQAAGDGAPGFQEWV